MWQPLIHSGMFSKVIADLVSALALVNLRW